MNANTLHQPGTPASPRDCPLLQSILATARQMFPGDPWEEVEPHLQRAWASIAEAAYCFEESYSLSSRRTALVGRGRLDGPL